MRIEIVFARPDHQALLDLDVPPGTTVGEAIRRAGLAERFPDDDLERCETGIWGQPVPRSRTLRAGERVELYRPLRMDPREARRRRAAHGRAMGDPVDIDKED
ncbi:MAG: RnfH family protein [Woeseiaceae bacterium]|nr:RnfH family protein [Woeseiaceae bacterium]